MPIFTPPVRLLGETTLASPHPGNQLYRHYVPRRVGVNVYVYADGTVGESDPPLGDITCQRVYHGGHIHTITDAEAAVLTAAGYGANIIGTATIAALNTYDTGLYGSAVYG